MTSPLSISWPSGSITDPTTAVTIGRDPGSTVAIDAQVVSRTHAVITWDNGRWVFRDLGSSFGSFVNGRRVGEIPIDGPLAILLGQGEDAVRLDVRVDRRTLEDPGRPAGGVLPPTAIGASRPSVGPSPARPGGALGGGRADPTLVRGDDAGPTLTVTEGGRSHVISARTGGSVGREADNSIVLDEPTVSRHHLRIDHTPDGWLVADLGSASGTWASGTRVTRLPVTGPVLVTVGDPATGPRLELRPQAAAGGAGGTRRKRGAGRWIAVVGAVVLVAAIAFGGWWFFLRQPEPAAADLNALAQATVFLEVTGDDGGSWSGSGTIVDAERGLILTNAHVAAPQSVGLAVREGTMYGDDQGVERIDVHVAPGLDRAAEPRFRADVVAADGYLDLAVLKISHTASGAPVGPADLASLVVVGVGDSDDVATGDQVLVVGYPGQVESGAATVSRGVITGSQPDDRLNAARAEFLSDAFSGAGNSGGLVANAAGEIVAVHSFGTRNPDRVTENALAGSRPVHFARPLIEAATTGAPYTSPWAAPAPAGATITGISFSGPDRSVGVDATCEPAAELGPVVSVAVDYSGFGSAKHTDVMVQLWAKDAAGQWKPIDAVHSAAGYPLALPDSGCLRATLPVRTADLPAGEYSVDVGIGGDYALKKSMSFTIT